MYGIRSREGKSSVSLCGCSQDRVHSHYGNIVLHISRNDLRDLGIAMQSVAEDAVISAQGQHVMKGSVH